MLRRTILAMATIVAFITAHELIHLWVGRALGLPAHFINLTAAGVTGAAALTAPAPALAWMNGSAPLFTIVIGLAAWALAPWARRRGLATVSEALGWLAIVGLPYLGMQLMLLAGRAQLRGDGADSAAVIAGYWGASAATRAVLALVGLGAAVGAGALLPRALIDSGQPDDVSTIARWRAAAAIACGALAVLAAALGVARLMRHPERSTSGLFIFALVACGVGAALATRWSSGTARQLRGEWIWPLVTAGVALGLASLISPSDYSVIGVILLPPLLIAAYVSR